MWEFMPEDLRWIYISYYFHMKNSLWIETQFMSNKKIYSILINYIQCHMKKVFSHKLFYAEVMLEIHDIFILIFQTIYYGNVLLISQMHCYCVWSVLRRHNEINYEKYKREVELLCGMYLNASFKS